MAEHTLTTLDSGIRVVTEQVPSVRSIALGLWVRVGSRDEREEEAGISHFLEHLLFKGTERLTAEQIAQIFDSFGAEMNAATSKETTVLYAHFLDELAAYHNGRYTPDRIVIAAAGNLEHDTITALAEEKLQPAGSSEEPEAEPEPEPDRRSGQMAFHQKDTEQYHICLGGPGIRRDDERRWALSVLDAVLGGSNSSRLFQEVREKRGLAYSIYSWASHYRDTGQLGIYVGTRQENVGEAMRVIGTELERLQVDSVTDEELTRAREHVK